MEKCYRIVLFNYLCSSKQFIPNRTCILNRTRPKDNIKIKINVVVVKRIMTATIYKHFSVSSGAIESTYVFSHSFLGKRSPIEWTSAAETTNT